MTNETNELKTYTMQQLYAHRWSQWSIWWTGY